MLFNQEKKLFLGERDGESGVWQFPQGGAEPELTLEENVLKEIEEETGISPKKVRIVKKLNATHEYDYARVPDYAQGKWRGQKQTFWLVEFLGDDCDINVQTSDAEFSGWRWCTVDEVKKYAEPKRLPGYEVPLKEFEEFTTKDTKSTKI